MAKEYTFVPEKGTARITADLNVRKGVPAAEGEVVKMLHAGTTQTYLGYVVDGQKVGENTTWYLSSEGDFFWSGNVDVHTVAGPTKLAKPLDVLVCTQRFGERAEFYAGLGSPKGHNGVDFRTRDPHNPADFKRPVYAVADGTITEASENALNGKFIRLAHSDGYESCYLHLSELNVSAGQKVTASTKIAMSGNTGSASEGPHLHFSFRPQKFDKENGFMGYIDPLPYFKDTVSFV